MIAASDGSRAVGRTGRNSTSPKSMPRMTPKGPHSLFFRLHFPFAFSHPCISPFVCRLSCSPTASAAHYLFAIPFYTASQRFLFLFSLMLVHSAVRLSSHASSSFNELSAITARFGREQRAAARSSPHKGDHARVENIELIVMDWCDWSTEKKYKRKSPRTVAPERQKRDEKSRRKRMD
jgi:hypothetical protein